MLGAKVEAVYALRVQKRKYFHLEYFAQSSLTSAGPGPEVQTVIHLLLSEYLNVTSEAHNLL